MTCAAVHTTHELGSCTWAWTSVPVHDTESGPGWRPSCPCRALHCKTASRQLCWTKHSRENHFMYYIYTYIYTYMHMHMHMHMHMYMYMYIIYTYIHVMYRDLHTQVHSACLCVCVALCARVFVWSACKFCICTDKRFSFLLTHMCILHAECSSGSLCVCTYVCMYVKYRITIYTRAYTQRHMHTYTYKHTNIQKVRSEPFLCFFTHSPPCRAEIREKKKPRK
jgi:hypothetical protein